MIKESEICSYFNKGQKSRISVTTSNDAVGFNYRTKRLWFFNHIRSVNGRMLDIGCNNGNLAFLLRKQGVLPKQLDYVGIDIAEESIKVAQNRNIYGAVFHVGSAMKLQFPDESFDAVTLVEVIEHIPDQPQAIREAVRVLKTGGLILLSTPNAECQPWLFDERVRFIVCRILGRKVVEKDDTLTLLRLKQILLNCDLKLIEGPRYYWYRPYHIFKGQLCWWPLHFAIKGLFGAMKHCIAIEESGHLTDEQKQKYCQSLLAAARKGKTNDE